MNFTRDRIIYAGRERNERVGKMTRNSGILATVINLVIVKEATEYSHHSSLYINVQKHEKKKQFYKKFCNTLNYV